MVRSKMTILMATTILTCATLFVPSSTLAQSAATSAAVATSSDAMEEIIISARKRDEGLQDVPISIGVVTASALADSGSVSLLQISSIAPGVNLAKSPSSSQVGVTIRGLGTSPGTPSFEGSVSLFVDGVYAPRSREFSASMFDIERIEVVKGTQAALLGKNTSLGAVNLITKKPGTEFSADIRGLYEFELESKLLTGGISIPLSDTVQVRLSGQYSDDAGWIDNAVGGKRNPQSKDNAARIVAVWTPIPALDFTFMAQRDELHTKGAVAEFVTTNSRVELLQSLAGAAGKTDTLLDRRNAISAPGFGQQSDEKMVYNRYGLTANYMIGANTLTSITNFSNYDTHEITDADLTAGDYLLRVVDETNEQFSQEIRLVSDDAGRLKYVVGGLYMNGTFDNAQFVDAAYPFGPAPGVNITGASKTFFVQDTKAFSAFSDVNYSVTDKVNLEVGLRYTTEEKSVDLSRVTLRPGLYANVLNPPYAPLSLSRKEENFDYSLGLQYRVSERIMAYTSYGVGSKAGGFASSATQLQNSEYEDEQSKTFEVGVKMQGADGRTRLNLAAFDTRVDNFQVVYFTGLAFIINNTDLKSQGFEVEGDWRPLDGVRLFVNSTYANARDRITEKAIPIAPMWSGNAGFSYKTELSSRFDISLDGSVDYRSKRYYQQNPASAPVGAAFTTYNLGLALADPAKAWEVRLIGRNLTDENAASFAFPTPIVGTLSAVSERPRTIALQVTLRR